MYTLLIALVLGCAVGTGIWYLTYSMVLSIGLGIVVVLLTNVLVSRHFMKKMQALMDTVEKDLRSERIEPALEKLKAAHKYSNWQFFAKRQINGQIGAVLYIRKRFDEAKPYLKDSFAKNWPAFCMLAAQYYREKDYENAFKIMEKAVVSNKKEAFVYSLYAWMLMEQGNSAKAIEVLNRGTAKLPLDERLANSLDAVKNKKKIKMQNYGAMWMQLHLGKSPDGVRQYQALLANQRIKRR